MERSTNRGRFSSDLTRGKHADRRWAHQTQSDPKCPTARSPSDCNWDAASSGWENDEERAAC